MTAEGKTYRLYKDLAWLWPLWGDVDEYLEECEVFVRLLRERATREVRTLLDIGCGGGKNAFHLKKHFELTGVDISEAMLSNARTLNPECEFLIGDMRTLDLGREFD
jgi:trans-aconitate methyltransferase